MGSGCFGVLGLGHLEGICKGIVHALQNDSLFRIGQNPVLRLIRGGLQEGLGDSVQLYFVQLIDACQGAVPGVGRDHSAQVADVDVVAVQILLYQVRGQCVLNCSTGGDQVDES